MCRNCSSNRCGGCRGPQGPTGPTGAKGETGQTGPNGQPGENGQPGDKGQIGEMGATGMTGPTGSVGPTGVIGPSGVKGQPGDDGGVEICQCLNPVITPGGTGQVSGDALGVHFTRKDMCYEISARLNIVPSISCDRNIYSFRIDASTFNLPPLFDGPAFLTSDCGFGTWSLPAYIADGSGCGFTNTGALDILFRLGDEDPNAAYFQCYMHKNFDPRLQEPGAQFVLGNLDLKFAGKFRYQ